MSFNLDTALWIAKIFIIYAVMVVVLPNFVMRGFFRGKPLGQKFLFSVVFGNFFYIMLVLFWGLFHITNRYVLIVSTLLIPAVMLIRNREMIWERYLKVLYTAAQRFVRRENSLRFLLRAMLRWIGGGLRKVGRKMRGFLRKNVWEMMLFIGCSAFLVWFYSSTNHFGPAFSDITLHMSWINEVDNGVLFKGGIYPFGMHALLYYMHAVFDIPTARIMLVFGTVQTFYIFTMLLLFLREICRFRYTPYLTYIAVVVGGYLAEDRFSRYYAALPQEFGLMFLLPCAIALIHFFESVCRENAEYKRMKREKLLYTKIDGKRRWKESTAWLWLLIISFGLTLSAHFYITILAVLLLVSVAIAYVRFLFSLKILRRLIVAAILAVLIPVLPMAAAFAAGTPLNGSLYWALGVMGVGASDDETEESTDTQETVSEEEMDAATAGETGTAVPMTEEEMAAAEAGTGQGPDLFQQLETIVRELLEIWVFPEGQLLDLWGCFMAAILIMVPIMWLFREWDYSRGLLLTFLFTAILLLLSVASEIGLPVIFDKDRSFGFFCYIVLCCFSLAVDGALVILSKIIRVPRLMQAISLILVAVFLFYTVGDGHVRKKDVEASSYQRDGAVLCTFDIMEHFPDQKWTLISCNEERNMVSPVAWHYEVIDFLQGMEDYEKDDEIYIPTKYVFFFVEKVSLNYAQEELTDTDASVSETWASMALPARNGLGQYQGINRIIVNSRMYYWAQEYMKRFPNEMKVYYEDDDFICYYIEQNEYFLNNFAIDYGYNSRGGAQ